jgi:hypothetical protein
MPTLQSPYRTAAEYRLVAKKGEGTFSEVLKAQCIKNGKYVAIKCMKNHFDSLDQVRSTDSGNVEAAECIGAGIAAAAVCSACRRQVVCCR